jgi:predicted RNase H-related nuclease YkuK (DUF458 family)
MQQNKHWRKLNGDIINGSIVDEINNLLSSKKEICDALKVCIGTDSQVKGTVTEFATVIVLIWKGKGGIMYIHNYSTPHKMSIKERMLVEVGESVEVAYLLRNIISGYNIEMEVHADINTNPSFKSHDALKDAMGYITGMGFTFKAKPDAFASSSCANKIVH